MEFTCLSRGRGIQFPASYILVASGIRILINCPLDLSALTIFSPLPDEFYSFEDGEESHCSDNDAADPKSTEAKRQKLEKNPDANDLILAAPWYKTVANLHLWNVSFIDVVLISSPYSMLGLPFLTRTNGFSAKVYATEAAAKLGKLMMDDLVSMHTEYIQFYGPEEAGGAKWMNWEQLESLPSALRESILGFDGTELGGWMQLYSAADVEDSVKKLQTIKFKEELFYNGALMLKASSSGSEIGACNWTIRGPTTSIACISNSLFGSAHALEFDYNALRGHNVILYADNSDTILEPNDNDNSSEDLLLGMDETSEESEKLDSICSLLVAAVKAGGSALIPIERLGIVLPLIEQLSVQLENSDVKVPVYIISSIAEEILAYTNIVPEWLCKQRQERLFSGEPLFAHVKLTKEGKVQVHDQIYSPKLLADWQEPAIVFCSHWNLRLGPVVHLLRRWHRDQNSVLVMEDNVDSSLALLPFCKTMKMKVLQCSFISGIRFKKLQPLLDILKPKLVLLPEKCWKQRSLDANPYSVAHYAVNETVRIPSPEGGLELDISPELITQLHWNTVGEENSSVTRLTGKLVVHNGRHQIVPSCELPHQKSRSLIHWGPPDIQRLLKCLSESGISASLPENGGNKDGGTVTANIVEIREPGKALIEVRETGTTIIAADKKLASHIFAAVDNVLDKV